VVFYPARTPNVEGSSPTAPRDGAYMDLHSWPLQCLSSSRKFSQLRSHTQLNVNGYRNRPAGKEPSGNGLPVKWRGESRTPTDGYHPEIIRLQGNGPSLQYRARVSIWKMQLCCAPAIAILRWHANSLLPQPWSLPASTPRQSLREPISGPRS